MTTKFYEGNPKMVAALLGAMKEATAWIKADKKAAAETYLRVTKDRMPLEEFLAMLNDPNIVITVEPKGADKISEFLARVGRVKVKPDNWKDYYFGDVDKLAELTPHTPLHLSPVGRGRPSAARSGEGNVTITWAPRRDPLARGEGATAIAARQAHDACPRKLSRRASRRIDPGLPPGSSSAPGSAGNKQQCRVRSGRRS